MPRSRAAATKSSKSSIVPSSRWTASWPPSSLPIAHGDPTSPGAAVAELLRPLRCTLPIGWIGGRYTTSNPISAMRGSCLGRGREGAVHRLAVGVPSAGRARKHLVPRAEAGQRPIHPYPELLAAGDQFAQRIRTSISSISGASASAARVTGSPGVRNAAAAASSGSRPRAARRWRPARTACAPISRSLDSSVSPCPASSLATIMPPGPDRITPAVHPERPQPDPVRE